MLNVVVKWKNGNTQWVPFEKDPEIGEILGWVLCMDDEDAAVLADNLMESGTLQYGTMTFEIE